MTKESLRKYRYVFDKEYKIPENYVNKYPNRIWIFWNKGIENASEFVKRCVESIKKYSGGRVVEILDDSNFDKYVEIPDYIVKKYKDGKISPALFSDIVRVVLLRDYGGTWIDASTYLTGDIPQYIFDAELFAPIYYNSVNAKNFYNYRSHVIIPNYFMSTNAPHNYLFLCWAEYYFESLKSLSTLPYFSVYAFPAIAIEENGRISDMILRLVDNKDRKNAELFWKLFDMLNKPFDKKKWEEIKKKFPIHKLPAKQVAGFVSKGVKSGTFLDKLQKGELN